MEFQYNQYTTKKVLLLQLAVGRLCWDMRANE